MGKIIDGEKIADGIIEKIKKKTKGTRLKLSVVLVGKDPASLSYISQKEKAALKAGIGFSLYQFPKNTKKEKLIKEIERISKDCSGLIVQLPLPFKDCDQEVLNSVPEEKDIDILSEKRLGRFYTGDFYLLPPVVGAFSHITKKEKINLKGKRIAIIGSGRLVGKPLSVWLMAQGATISVVNKSTDDISFFTRKADIVISGVGKQGLIKRDMVKKGVIAIDAGSSFEKGKIRGDFDKSVYSKASFYTPVPGGVGPITTTRLVENLVKLNNYGLPYL